MVIKCMCSIADPNRRVVPPKSPDVVEFDDKNYDFIIVGSGSAGQTMSSFLINFFMQQQFRTGSVLAGRISENPKHNVLLIEAGPEEPISPSIPMFFFTALDTELDWKYETVPQKNACLSNGGVCNWPRGKMMCGTACMSGMMYTRGSPQIYNAWNAAGNDGWSYAEVLDYFKKSENNTQPLSSIEPEFHGFSGPMTVGTFSHFPKLGTNFLEAAKEIGYSVRDVNGKYQTGFFRAAVMIKDSLRASPNRIYIRPALKRKNLRVLLESHVIKIDFNEKGNQATGIVFRDKYGNIRKFRARKEIIVAGGVVGSPQLLLLSGVGPKPDLEKHGIPVVKDLPVGHNLHVHYGVAIAVRMKEKPESTFTLEAFYEFVTNRTGPFSSTTLTQISGFIESKYAKENIPDVQIFIDEYDDECGKFKRDQNVSKIALRPVYILSKCRGTLKLRSPDPYDKPMIDPNYLCDENEIDALIDAIKILKRLMSSPTMKNSVIQFDAGEYKNCDSLQKDSDCYWRCRIKHYTLAENHHGGTCKMGPSDDPTTVIDPKFRVHGVNNLRVVDAAIMPSPINGNPIGPIIMFAEKASDLIKNQWK
ncbi:hypothetical protein HA402_003427 [Bradysia odoriphaga]|nr:hypothetical protein HA402_003427 [Bradysia odoriphaga]